MQLFLVIHIKEFWYTPCVFNIILLLDWFSKLYYKVKHWKKPYNLTVLSLPIRFYMLFPGLYTLLLAAYFCNWRYCYGNSITHCISTIIIKLLRSVNLYTSCICLTVKMCTATANVLILRYPWLPKDVCWWGYWASSIHVWNIMYFRMYIFVR